MINWNKLAYTQDELTEAWSNAIFVNDVAESLNLSATTSQLRTLKRIGSELSLPDKPIWTKPFSVQEFMDAWKHSLTMQEVAQKLGTNTRGFETIRLALGLEEKTNTQKTVYSQEAFLDAWEESRTLDQVAQRLELPSNKKTFANLSHIARTLDLPAKQKEVPMTDTGEDSSAIIASWIDWHLEYFHVQPLSTHIKMAAKTVKELIVSGYGTESIKWGLWKWSLQLKDGYAPINLLAQETNMHHERNNPEIERKAEQLRALASQDAPKTSKMRRVQIEGKKW